MFRKLLVALDGSDLARAILPFTYALVRGSEDSVLIVPPRQDDQG